MLLQKTVPEVYQINTIVPTPITHNIGIRFTITAFRLFLL